jgi:membrane protein
MIVIAVAGLVFGQEPVRGEIFYQLQGLLGDEGGTAVQDISGCISAEAI